ncbi:pullulanase [bacterium]|nr:pullulanase [bacterium]
MKRSSIISALALVSFILIPQISKGENLYLSETRYTRSFTDSTEFQKRYKELDQFYSDKKLGSFVIDGKTYFRLFAPTALGVKVCLFKNPEDKKSKEFFLTRDKDGVWEIDIDEELYGSYYGYKIFHKGDDISNENQSICVDPYAKAVSSNTTYMNPRRAIVMKNVPYDWEGTHWIQRDWRDLIIYEMHVRDMTAHKSSGAKNRGSYKGLTEKGIQGGINYIKALGVNTVELLPSQEFGSIEIPFMDSLSGKFNTWNPYERNHWGYMTSNFFAPSAYYNESCEKMKWNKWIGKNGLQVNAFKDMVKAFHKEGIGVIMDVVYNHLSEYEIGNLKQIDKDYYFRMDAKGNYITESFCGNDLKTERPMMRRLIIESILYWMKEYHVDGFRFDLGKLLDWETIESIIAEARKVNPNVIFTCEPWGGGYDPAGFSKRDWAPWNDQIRNGIKGENPKDGLGWIFGKWYGNNSPKRITSYVNGTLIRDTLGLFQRKEHSVNYLESHDGYTLGDFIRIGTREVDPEKKIKDVDKNVKLTIVQMKLNKLGALFLLTSQGMTMLHEGQEFARSKVIASTDHVKDRDKGKIDHNSYNKDNETNYINYKHAEINKELLNYYKGLITLRSTYDAFRRADYDNIVFYEHPLSKFGLGYILKHEQDSFIVLFNADPKEELDYTLPEGTWQVLADKNCAGLKSMYELRGKIKLENSTGMVLKLK